MKFLFFTEEYLFAFWSEGNRELAGVAEAE